MAATDPFRRTTPRRLAIGIAFLGALLGVPSAASQGDELSVRAAYLFNLTKYVNWPPSQARIVIGVLGDNATTEAFRQILQNKTTDGRPIEVLIHPTDADLRRCDVVYFDRTEPTTAEQLQEKLDDQPCLTVGESERFVREGGMVGLVRSGDQIQILINLDATQKRGMALSSRLMSLAVLVRSAGRSR